MKLPGPYYKAHSSPQTFWHQGPGAWRTGFLETGGVGVGWFQDDSSALHSLHFISIIFHFSDFILMSATHVCIPFLHIKTKGPHSKPQHPEKGVDKS